MERLKLCSVSTINKLLWKAWTFPSLLACVVIKWDLGTIVASKVTKPKKHLEQLASFLSFLKGTEISYQFPLLSSRCWFIFNNNFELEILKYCTAASVKIHITWLIVLRMWSSSGELSYPWKERKNADSVPEIWSSALFRKGHIRRPGVFS